MSISSANITAQAPLFQSLISKWESTQGAPTTFPTPIEDLQRGRERSGKDVLIALRTRPPLETERTRFKLQPSEATSLEDHNIPISDFCMGVHVISAEPGKMVAHVPGMKWNGPTLVHKSFESDIAFAPTISNEEVYRRTVEAQSMIELVLGGGVGCVLAYGQTGSGKTHTMESVEGFVARDLFKLAGEASTKLRERTGNTSAESVFEFRVSFLELLGKTATDLVHGGGSTRALVEVTETKSGSVRPRLEEVLVRSSEELEALIAESLSHRRTSPTARNPQSSRSHAMLTIWVKNLLLPHTDEGQLILVDLAGSERYDDSKDHDRVRIDETRENNASLANLKDCIRAKAKAMREESAFVHIPFRSNRLTLLLKPIFDLESTQLTKITVIAHVSPHLQDAAHTVNTLSYAAPFKVAIPQSRRPRPYDPLDPRTWDNKRMVEWLTKEFDDLAQKRLMANGNKAEEADAAVELTINPTVLCPPPLGGKHMSRLYCSEWVEACLSAANLPTPLDAETQHLVTRDALETYSMLGYLWATARTRTRKALLRTRNEIPEEELGDAPIEWSEDIRSMTPSLTILEFEREHGPEHHAAVRKAIAEATAKGSSIEDAQRSVEVAALEQWSQRKMGNTP